MQRFVAWRLMVLWLIVACIGAGACSSAGIVPESALDRALRAAEWRDHGIALGDDVLRPLVLGLARSAHPNQHDLALYERQLQGSPAFGPLWGRQMRQWVAQDVTVYTSVSANLTSRAVVLLTVPVVDVQRQPAMVFARLQTEQPGHLDQLAHALATRVYGMGEQMSYNDPNYGRVVIVIGYRT